MRFNGLITKTLISVSLCVATAPAYANAACQGAGCVLPVTDAPPPPAEAVVVEEETGLGIWPIIIGIAALALVAWLVLDDDEDSESP